MVATKFRFYEDLIFALGMLAIFGLILLCRILCVEPKIITRRHWRILRWWSERRRQRSKELLERMAEDNKKMERSTEGNPIPTISGDKFLILCGARITVHSA
ncbi:unnamed protein product [Malus baccata var. baccata]